MDAEKLFRVLVIGGAMLSVGCVEEAPAPVDGAAPAARDASALVSDAAPMSELDARVSPIGVDASSPVDAGEPVECGLCPSEECCETDASGNSHERAGLMCCWGTAC